MGKCVWGGLWGPKEEKERYCFNQALGEGKIRVETQKVEDWVSKSSPEGLLFLKPSSLELHAVGWGVLRSRQALPEPPPLDSCQLPVCCGIWVPGIFLQEIEFGA